MCGYLHYCHLPVSFDQSGPSPLTSLINDCVFAHRTAAHWMFFVFAHSLQTLETVVHENPRRSAVSEILQTTLSGTNNHSTVKVTWITFLPHSDIWSEKQLNLLTMSTCFYAFSCCHMIG